MDSQLVIIIIDANKVTFEVRVIFLHITMGFTESHRKILASSNRLKTILVFGITKLRFYENSVPGGFLFIFLNHD